MDRRSEDTAATAGGRAEAAKGRVLSVVLLIVLGFLSLVSLIGLVYLPANYRPYVIPQGAMMPAFEPGDRMLARRDYYMSHEVRRGDIAAFRQPGWEEVIFVMRVVGLPGERIRLKDGILHIDGKAVARREAVDATFGSPDPDDPDARHYVETLPGGASYRIIEASGDASDSDNTPVFEVPPGHVFVLGDNRDNSLDSRRIGPVPTENLMDRPEFIIWSKDRSRIGRSVQP